MCDWRCRNYPVKTCFDKCGVIVLINAALAASDRSLFQFLTGPYEKVHVYLQRPSQHAYYIRIILMSWFAESPIEINYVLLHPDWRNNISDKSDHSFCLRQDTSCITRKKLKLSLNHKASSSTETSSSATQNHAASNEIFSPTPAEASVPNTQASNASSSISNTPLFATTDDLIWHLNNQDGRDLKIESMTFKNMAESVRDGRM